MKNIRYINAGAGSGKTFSLTKTFADLVKDEKTTPSRVILTTFTDRAASEFRLKAREMFISQGLHSKAAELDSALIGTVHSVAMRYIMRYWYLLGLGAGVKPLPEEEKDFYISSTLSGVASQEDLQVFGEYAERFNLKMSGKTSKIDYDFWKDNVKSIIEKADTFSIEDLTYSEEGSLALFKEMFPGVETGDSDRLLQQDVIRRAFRIAREWRVSYNRYKKDHNLVSFNDMERLFIQLLNEDVVIKDIADSIDYVFVDEFQDSNPTQVRIFDLLSEIVNKGSFWVGDPKQAIYDFRGCDTELTTAITSIVEKKAASGMDGCSYEVLPNSWRSDPYLVDLTNKAFVPVFSNQLSEDKVVLNPIRKASLPSNVLNAYHWEFAGIVPEGKTRVSYAKEHVQRAIAAAVCSILKGEHRIKQVVDKEKNAIRDILPSDIAILCDSNADCNAISSYLRSLNIPVSRDLEVNSGRKEVAVIIAVLNYIIGDTSLLDAELSTLLADSEVKTLLEDKGSIRNLLVFSRLDAMKKRLRGKSVPYVVSSVINELDLENLVIKWGNGQERREVLESIKNSALVYEERCLSSSLAATLGGFVSFLSTYPIKVDRDIQTGGVNVLTYHSSKGLEWGVVIMYSLDRDDLEENKFLKRQYIGVNETRLNPPTEENVYSDYSIRFIPQYLHGKSNLPDDVKRVLLTQPDLTDRKEHVYGQMSRMLYVGATRARDYLITVGAKDGMKWLTTLGITSDVDYKSPMGRYNVWGPNAPLSEMEFITVDCQPMTDNVREYTLLHPCNEERSFTQKYKAPSSDKNIRGIDFKTESVFPESGRATERITVSGSVSAYDVFGTCIHNIFAAYRPGDDKLNFEVAQKTILRYGMSQTLQKPSEIVRAEENLFSFLERKYGAATCVFHELPFTFIDEDNDQVVTGEMDLVWETSDGCVLVDFKNYPGFDNVLNTDSVFYVGKYFPQIYNYQRALGKAGKKVLDSLIFYSVLGRCIRVF